MFSVERGEQDYCEGMTSNVFKEYSADRLTHSSNLIQVIQPEYYSQNLETGLTITEKSLLSPSK